MIEEIQKINKIICTYKRVSTSNQENEGTIETQNLAVIEFAKKQGYTIVQEYVDNGWSGDSLARPALDQLRMDAKKKNWEAVLIYDPDRLARRGAWQEVVMEELKELEIDVLFVTIPQAKTDEDKIMYKMRGVFTEYERMKIKDSKIDKCKIFPSLKEFIINTEGKEKTFETIIYTKEKPEKVIFKGTTENHDPDPLLFKELYRREKNNILGVIHNVQKGYYLQVTMHYSYSGSICNMKIIRQGKTEKNINNHISMNIGMKGGKTNDELRKMTIEQLDSIILPIIEPYDKRVKLENMVAVKVCCPFCDKVQYVNESKLFKKEICSCGKEIEPIFDMIE